MTTAYLQDYEQLAGSGAPAGSRVEALRAAGAERFQAAGFPTSKDEDWRFINLSPLTGRSFRLPRGAGATVAATALEPFLFPIAGVHHVVFVNGAFAPRLSSIGTLPAGVVVTNLAAAASQHPDLVEQHLGRHARVEDHGFTALNAALLGDGLVVRVPRGVAMEAPIHALFLTDTDSADTATHPRNLIVLEGGATASVIETHAGLRDAAYFTNAVTEAVIGDAANLTHLKIQRESEQAFHIGTTHLAHGRDSRGVSHSVSFGAALCRNNLDVVLDGPGVEAEMLGLYMGRGRQEVDNHTSLLHAHPNCNTREIYKGILDGRSHGVFNGKIYVTPIAQKTDAKQTNRALLLSDDASIDTKPQLEIFADDVKCTHGATVGNLDQLAAFYLQSRGVGGALGRRILTYAFAAEVLEEIPWESVRSGLEAVVMERLEDAER